ncbi:MAG: 4-hydroxy-3-methylbut-2-enyl diphosphate reductase [Clostridiales bacterium]|nr:4-hydroxy-3-methylbut-2-enyl diphosphate reductase [Clostridiales bacterium]
MDIIVSKNIGFCFGVRQAVDKAFETAEAVKRAGGGAKAYCYGAIVHNARVTARLAAAGIKTVDGLEDIKRGDSVIIRAHGVPPEVVEAIGQRGAKIIDCTCPFVKKTHAVVKEKFDRGYDIIIVGEARHPEVAGINGCADYKAAVVSGYAEIDAIIRQKSAQEKSPGICVVFQTTYDREKYSEIVKKTQKETLKTVEIFDTICYTTIKRQNEAKKIARVCDAAIVVGDPQSSNTRKLYDLTLRYCPKVYFITDLSDLQKVDSKNIKKLGIVTGASASDELIMEVVFTMSKAQQSGELEAATAAAEVTAESAVSNNQSTETKPEKAAAKAEKTEQSVNEAEKAAAEALKKAAAIEKKAALAQKKAEEAKRKLEEAEKIAAEADKRAAEAERKAAEAEKRIDTEEIKVMLAEKKAAAKAAEAEKRVDAEEVKASPTPSEKPQAAETATAEAALAKLAEPVAEKKAVPVKRAVKPAEPEEKMTMEDVMSSKDSMFTYRSGKKVAAIVLNANENGVNVRIGGKKDGFIDKSEMNIDGSYDPSLYKVNDIIDAVIIENPTKGASYINLSKKQIDQIKENDKLGEEALKGGEFELVCDKVVKGGITGKYGSYTVFVPASQIRIGFVKNLEDYLGKKLRLTVLPPKEKELAEAAPTETADGQEVVAATVAEASARPSRSGRFIVASQRVILERERKAKEDEFWSRMIVGDVVSGKVKRFVTFGAFVGVGGFDCLVHISDISWNRINDPSTVLEINGVYDFVVLKVDRESQKVSLGYKQLQRKPYELAYERFPVGSVVTGVVERIKDFGAFISLDDGVDGLVHVSQISHDWIKNANEVLKVGDTVTAKVISFEDNKITLSIKELLEKPEITEESYDDGEYTSESRENKFKKREGKREKSAGAMPSASAARDRSDGGAAGRPKKPGRPRTDDAFEQKEWVSSSATTSLGDLFKGLKLEDAQEETQAETQAETQEE